MKNANIKRFGFTLIELLVVVLIVGILAAVAVPQYQKAVLKARFVQLRTAMDSLSKSNEVYFMANGKYAADFDSFEIPAAGCTLSDDKIYFNCPFGQCYNWNNGYNYGCWFAIKDKRLYLESFPYSNIKQCIAWGNTVSETDPEYQMCNSLPHSRSYADDCGINCYRFLLTE